MSQFDAFARYYDADFGAVEDDIPFYRELARRCGGPILEPMCGSGRLLVPLARAGYRLTGVDVSSALLALARAKLTAGGLLGQVELLEADIRQTAPAGPFGLVIVALNSFMHLSTATDQLAALGRIHAALRPDGLLALDLFNPDLRALAAYNGELVFDKSFVTSEDARVHKFVAQHADTAAQIIYIHFIYDELDAEGRVRRNVLPFTMRWLYRYELEHLLARAGFALEAVYGSYDLDEYRPESELMLAVARKVKRETC
jgi:SAM-dependent methyltransferase